MRKIYGLLGITALLAAAAMLSAQSDSDYQGYMKIVGPTNASMQKNIAAKDAKATEMDAEKLHNTFKMVEAFWEKRGAADAVNFAKNAQNVTEMVAKAAAAGDMDKAAADAKGLGANCGGCHMAHREKTDAGFKIK